VSTEHPHVDSMFKLIPPRFGFICRYRSTLPSLLKPNFAKDYRRQGFAFSTR